MSLFLGVVDWMPGSGRNFRFPETGNVKTEPLGPQAALRSLGTLEDVPAAGTGVKFGDHAVHVGIGASGVGGAIHLPGVEIHLAAAPRAQESAARRNLRLLVIHRHPSSGTFSRP
jgi:hypothetical protein